MIKHSDSRAHVFNRLMHTSVSIFKDVTIYLTYNDEMIGSTSVLAGFLKEG